MGYLAMKTKKPTEKEIDQIVVGQADNDNSWDEPVQVKREKLTSLTIPADLAARAAFLAKLHRTKSLDEWLAHIIRERVELEEAAFAGTKQDLSRAA